MFSPLRATMKPRRFSSRTSAVSGTPAPESQPDPTPTEPVALAAGESAADTQPQPAVMLDDAGDGAGPRSFEDVLALCSQHKERFLAFDLTHNVHLVSFKPGHIDVRLTAKAKPNLPNVLSQKLGEWTGDQWMVTVSREQGDDTVGEQKKQHQQRLEDEVSEHPLVKAALDTFPGASITGIIEHSEPLDDIPLPEEEDDEA